MCQIDKLDRSTYNGFGITPEFPDIPEEEGWSYRSA